MRKRVLATYIHLFRMLRGKGLWRVPTLQPIAFWLFDHLQPTGAETVSFADYKVVVDYAYISDVVRELIMNDYHQKYEMELFRSVIRNGDTVVEIGANVGFYSLAASPRVGETGKVVAFEPQPDNYRFLVENIKLNGFQNIMPVCKAVSDKVGQATFYFARKHLTECGFGDYGKWPSFTVDTVTLDSYFGNGRVDVIKMDIEGAEALALKGMAGLLRANKRLKIFSEFSIPMMSTLRCNPADYLYSLVANGFKLYNIHYSHEKLESCGVNEIMERAKKCVALKLFCERD